MRYVSFLGSILGLAVGTASLGCSEDSSPQPVGVGTSGTPGTATDGANTGTTSDNTAQTDSPASSGEGGTTTGAGTSDTADTSGGEGSSSSGDAVVNKGPGCNITPTCDRGALAASVRITSASQIEEIAGYTSITGWLEVDESDLVCLDFLACLETVGHDVTIFDNTELLDTRGLSALTTLGTATVGDGYNFWDGSLVISENASLEEIAGFDSLENIQESLHMSGNPALIEITGFPVLTEIQHNLAVHLNQTLESIDGLQGMERILGQFNMTNNPSLCLSNINEVGTALLEAPAGGSTAANGPC